MITRADLLGAAVLSGIFLALLAVAEAWRRLGDPKPEWTRKLVHLGGGLACLCFPFLVRSPWVVLALALALSGLFAFAGKIGWLKSLHGVGRSSRGAEYYPLAIFLVFLLARDRPWVYLSAVLVLAVGDAFAALIGRSYGVLRYEVEDESKTVEGSLVFLTIAFLAIHLPTLLLADLPRPTTVLAALLVALLVTGLEAISLEGADNLFVPLAVVVVLGKITTKPLAEIAFQNLSLVAICLLVALLVRRFPFFNVGASIAFILYAYGTWSLGSWLWALPVFAGFLCFLLVWFRVARPRRESQVRVRTVARALLGPLVLLAVANGTRAFGTFFGPYLAASAAVLAFTLAPPVVAGELVRGLSPRAGLLGVAVLATLATSLVPWLVQPGVPALPLLTVCALVLAGTALNHRLERRAAEPAPGWTASRFLLSLAAAGAVLVLQTAGLIPAWRPG